MVSKKEKIKDLNFLGLKLSFILFFFVKLLILLSLFSFLPACEKKESLKEKKIEAKKPVVFPKKLKRASVSRGYLIFIKEARFSGKDFTEVYTLDFSKREVRKEREIKGGPLSLASVLYGKGVVIETASKDGKSDYYLFLPKEKLFKLLTKGHYGYTISWNSQSYYPGGKYIYLYEGDASSEANKIIDRRYFFRLDLLTGKKERKSTYLKVNGAADICSVPSPNDIYRLESRMVEVSSTNLTFIDTRRNQITLLTRQGTLSHKICWSPDSRLVFFTLGPSLSAQEGGYLPTYYELWLYFVESNKLIKTREKAESIELIGFTDPRTFWFSLNKENNLENQADKLKICKVRKESIKSIQEVKSVSVSGLAVPLWKKEALALLDEKGNLFIVQPGKDPLLFGRNFTGIQGMAYVR